MLFYIPLFAHRWWVEERKSEKENMVIFLFFPLNIFSVSCYYYNDGNNNIVEEYFKPFLQFCVSNATHTNFERDIYELPLVATNPIMFKIYGFDAAAKLTLSSENDEC